MFKRTSIFKSVHQKVMTQEERKWAIREAKIAIGKLSNEEKLEAINEFHAALSCIRFMEYDLQKTLLTSSDDLDVCSHALRSYSLESLKKLDQELYQSGIFIVNTLHERSLKILTKCYDQWFRRLHELIGEGSLVYRNGQVSISPELVEACTLDEREDISLSIKNVSITLGNRARDMGEDVQLRIRSKMRQYNGLYHVIRN